MNNVDELKSINLSGNQLRDIYLINAVRYSRFLAVIIILFFTTTAKAQKDGIKEKIMQPFLPPNQPGKAQV